MAKGDRGRRGRKEYKETARRDEKGRKDKERSYQKEKEAREEKERKEREWEQKRKEKRDAERREMERKREARRKAKEDLEGQGKPKEKPKEEKSYWDRVKDYFGGEDDEGGFSAAGGSESYGTSKKEFDETIGKGRHNSRSLSERLGRELEYFQEAPLDYASDLLDNPLIAGATAMTGLGMTAFGVKVLDSAVDLFQGETDLMGAAKQVGSSAISSTPVGSAIPDVARGIAKSTIEQGASGFAKGTGTVVGGSAGGNVGSTIADAVTDNPYAKAAITAASSVAGAIGGKKAAAGELFDGGGKPQGSRESSRESSEGLSAKGDKPTSPLVASGEKAVRESKKLMQPADAGLYARTVSQLPYYGLDTTQQQMPYYGV